MTHNTEKTYYELLAKLLLEAFLPDKYSNLDVSDKPDLRMGKDHGIEVTRAINRGQGKAFGILNHIQLKNTDEVDQRYLNTLRRTNYRPLVHHGKIVGLAPCEAYWKNIEVLKHAFRKKVRIAANYQLPKVDLFIFSPFFDCFDESDIREFVNWTDKSYSVGFSSIIVHDEPNLYIYDTDQSSFHRIVTGHDIVIQLCQAAKDIAIQGSDSP